MKEIACQFGANDRLSGILTLSTNTTSKIALILVSAGLCANHGPFRLYTHIARKVASLGIHVFRFDLGNIGSSKAINLHLPLQERTSAEIEEALNYLETKFNISQFYLGGLCSGAEDSFRYAEHDERVIGLLLMDPFAYKTKAVRVKQLLTRVWSAVLKLRLLTHKDYRLNYEDTYVPNLVDYRFIQEEESSRIIKSLLTRKVWFHFIYTSGQIAVFNHRAQFWKMLPQFKNYPYVALDHLPELSHTQILLEDKEHLSHVVEQGVRRFLQNQSTPL